MEMRIILLLRISLLPIPVCTTTDLDASDVSTPQLVAAFLLSSFWLCTMTDVDASSASTSQLIAVLVRSVSVLCSVLHA